MAAWDYQNPDSRRVRSAGRAVRRVSWARHAAARAMDRLPGARRARSALQIRCRCRRSCRPADLVAGRCCRTRYFKSIQPMRRPVHTPGLIPPHSAAVHPSPTGSVAVAWRSPIAGVIRIRGRIADGDPNGGDGVAWSVVRRRGHASDKLVAGVIDNGGSQDLAALADLRPLDHVDVQPGDAIWLAISPRSGYGFDTTIIELEISEAITGGRTWSLARRRHCRSARCRAWQSASRRLGECGSVGVSRPGGGLGRRGPRSSQFAIGPLVRQ